METTTSNENETQPTPQALTGEGSVHGLFAVIGEDGWESPDNPPSNDRVVQIAWDDMSTSENSLGFYDGIAEIPDSGRRYWWTHPGMTQLDKSAIGAWRDISANAKDTHGDSR